MKKLTIDRSKWRTGGTQVVPYRKNITGIGSTALKNQHGYMCCLGFWCMQAGVPEEKYNLVGTPTTLAEGMPNAKDIVPELIDNDGKSTDLAHALMAINDSTTTTPEEKETAIAKKLALIGMEVEFTGEYTRNTE